MRARWIIAAVLVVVGLGWMAQGGGLMPGSGLMDGDTRWAIIGAVLAVVGVAIGWTAFRARSRA
jgi:hypothetical protein